MVEPYQDGHPKRGNDAIPPAYPHYQPLPHSEGPPAYPSFANPQGYPPPGYPPQGFPPQNYPPQGYPPQAYPPQGYPPQPYQVHPDQHHDHHAHHKKNTPTYGSIFLIIIGVVWFFLAFFGNAASFIIPSFYLISGILGLIDSGKAGLVISIIIQFLLTIINGLITLGTVVATLSTRDFTPSEGFVMFLIFGGLTTGHIISLVQFFKAVI